MKEYVLDANAVTRYLGASRGGGLDKVDDLIELARQDRVILLMSVVNLGEAGYVLLKNFGVEKTARALRRIENTIRMVDADYDAAMEAARYRHNYHLSYADAFAAALALKRKATLVSVDASFEKLGEKLKWLGCPLMHRRSKRKLCPT